MVRAPSSWTVSVVIERILPSIVPFAVVTWISAAAHGVEQRGLGGQRAGVEGEIAEGSLGGVLRREGDLAHAALGVEDDDALQHVVHLIERQPRAGAPRRGGPRPRTRSTPRPRWRAGPSARRAPRPLRRAAPARRMPGPRAGALPSMIDVSSRLPAVSRSRGGSRAGSVGPDARPRRGACRRHDAGSPRSLVRPVARAARGRLRAPMIPAEPFESRLIASRLLSPAVREMIFERTDPRPFHFDPGQWVNLVLPVPGGEIKRAYSIASPPVQGARRFEIRGNSSYRRPAPSTSTRCQKARRSAPSARTASSPAGPTRARPRSSSHRDGRHAAPQHGQGGDRRRRRRALVDPLRRPPRGGRALPRRARGAGAGAHPTSATRSRLSPPCRGMARAARLRPEPPRRAPRRVARGRGDGAPPRLRVWVWTGWSPPSETTCETIWGSIGSTSTPSDMIE